MPRITPVHWKVLECIFLKDGFKYLRQKGDHRSYYKPGCSRPVIIPTWDEVQKDLILSNLRTAKMSREIYFKYLKECKSRA